MMTRKGRYFATALLTFALAIGLGFVLFPPRTFKVVNRDGTNGPGIGASGKGTGMATSSWVSSDGMSVDQVVVGYSSVEDARSDFELERSRAERIIESSAESSRMIAQFGTSFKIVSLERNQITYVQASRLESVLAFEKSWCKVSW